MALVYEKGQPALTSDWLFNSAASAPAIIGDAIDAAGEKVALIGSVWHPTIKTGTINIRRVHFRAGGLTLNAATELRVSLQNLSQTAGPPYQPDGTQDQFYDFKTATTAITPSTWNTTGNLSADRPVNLASDSASDANPRRLAVVFEFQVFNTSDTINIVSLSTTNNFAELMGVVLNTGTWATVNNRTPCVAFECDDGSFAFMTSTFPVVAVPGQTVNSNGAVRRAGVKFRVPTARTLDRVALCMAVPNACDGRLVVYDSDGTTELRSVDVDNDDVRSTSTNGFIDVCIEPVTLLANTFYRMVFVGGTTTMGTVHGAEVSVAELMDAFVLGQDAHWTQHDGTSWTDIVTRRPIFGLGFGAYDNGAAGGGGGVKRHPGMEGGVNA